MSKIIKQVSRGGIGVEARETDDGSLIIIAGIVLENRRIIPAVEWRSLINQEQALDLMILDLVATIRSAAATIADEGRSHER